MTLSKARAVAIIWLVMSTSVLSVRDREVKKTGKVTIESGGVKGQRKAYSNRTSTASSSPNPCYSNPLPKGYEEKCQVLPIATSNGAQVLNWTCSRWAKKGDDTFCPEGFYCSQNWWTKGLRNKCRESLEGKPCGGTKPAEKVEYKIEVTDDLCTMPNHVCNKATWQCVRHDDDHFGKKRSENVLATCDCHQKGGPGDNVVTPGQNACCDDDRLICGRQGRCKVRKQAACWSFDMGLFQQLQLGSTMCAQGTYGGKGRGIDCHDSYKGGTRCCIPSTVGPTASKSDVETIDWDHVPPPTGAPDKTFCCSGCMAKWNFDGLDHWWCTYRPPSAYHYPTKYSEVECAAA